MPHSRHERVVPLGEAHLRELVNEYVQHYEHERPHQGLGGELIVRRRACGTGPVRTRRRLGGLLNHYERHAACFRPPRPPRAVAESPIASVSSAHIAENDLPSVPRL